MIFTVELWVVLLLSLAQHELGHIVAMRECSVKVFKVGFGIQCLRFLPTIRLPSKLRSLPYARIYIHPLTLFIGEYVLPSRRDMRELSRKDKTYVYGAGPLSNFIFGAVFFGIGWVLPLSESSEYLNELPLRLVESGVALAAAVAMWRFRADICSYALLPLGICVTFFVLVGPKFGLDFNPFEFGKSLAGIQTKGSSHGIVLADAGVLTHLYALVLTGAVLSVWLGLINLLPVVPLDGGHLMRQVQNNALRVVYQTAKYVAIGIWGLWVLGF